jgi:tRNA threonylcarbamoyladenosine biosynthesis protein TsaB
MSLILNIDTALEVASISLAKDGSSIALAKNDLPKEHASWLQAAIAELVQKSSYTLKELDAVAVSIGPGSYTGLRVGLSSAKGLCYALSIPLIAVGTLEMLAAAVVSEAAGLICPVIDARRMEIFTALYDRQLNELTKPGAMIIDESSFTEDLAAGNILFCGSGIAKLQKLIVNPNAVYTETMGNASQLGQLSAEKFRRKAFAQLAYTEPLYIKDFYSPARQPLT